MAKPKDPCDFAVTTDHPLARFGVTKVHVAQKLEVGLQRGDVVLYFKNGKMTMGSTHGFMPEPEGGVVISNSDRFRLMKYGLMLRAECLSKIKGRKQP
jgi:hypothetical protein